MILEKMFDTAVEAKDPKRVEMIRVDDDQAEGLALLLKKQGIEKTFDIKGELEKPYYLEQKARREKREAEAAKEKDAEAKTEEKQVKEDVKEKETHTKDDAKEKEAHKNEEVHKEKAHKKEEAHKDKEAPNTTTDKKQ